MKSFQYVLLTALVSSVALNAGKGKTDEQQEPLDELRGPVAAALALLPEVIEQKPTHALVTSSPHLPTISAAIPISQNRSPITLNQVLPKGSPLATPEDMELPNHSTPKNQRRIINNNNNQ